MVLAAVRAGYGTGEIGAEVTGAFVWLSTD
jgi:hypothetical protein